MFLRLEAHGRGFSPSWHNYIGRLPSSSARQLIQLNRMGSPRYFGSSDESLLLPLARHGDVVPATEDRSYLVFIASALILALGAGFALAFLIPHVPLRALDWVTRYPQLVQAHGWAQLQGWAGLFVAGMALRLIPRFAGRRPLPTLVTLSLFVLLLSGIVLRVVGQLAANNTWGNVVLLIGALTGGAGMLGLALAIVVTLQRGRQRQEPWRYLAWAGAAWWAVWAALTVAAGLQAMGNAGLVPAYLDEPATWLALLGAIGNFIWGVQSRSVPVFFGRRPPSVSHLAIPGGLLNGGLLLILLALLLEDSQRLNAVGFTMAGAALIWLPAVAGSLYGRAHRLRPRARAAAWFVLAANWWAVVAGALLLWGGLEAVILGDVLSFPVRDAARHALGVGLITMLLIGMAQLIAPIFALERAEARSPGIEYRFGWPALVCAAGLRVAAALLAGHIDERVRLDLITVAGGLAWLGLATFAWSMVRARRKEPRMKALLASAVPESLGGVNRSADEG